LNQSLPQGGIEPPSSLNGGLAMTPGALSG